MTTRTLTGLGNTYASLAGFIDEMMDPRAPMVMAGDILEFDPNASTTLTIDNKNLMVMGTLRMRPASSSVIHTLKFTNVTEALFTGGALRPISGATRAGTSATFTLTLELGQTSHNLTTFDKVHISNVAVAGYNSAPGVPWQITAVTATTVTVTLATTPASDYTPTGTEKPPPVLLADTPTKNDIGLWVMGAGVADLVGTTKKEWTRAAGDIAVNAGSVVCVDDLSTWQVGDNIVIAPSDLSASDYDYRTVASIGGAGNKTVTFNQTTSTDPSSAVLGTSYEHPSITNPVTSVVYGTELLNITRNVRIEGQDATHRTHMMIHNTSAVVKTLKYGRFRFMGPRQAAGGADDSVVVGRWPLHIHKDEAFSAGSLVEGWVVWDAGSHAYVQHASNGITLRGCIAHNVSTAPFWWDTDTFRDSPDQVVWDRCVGSRIDSGNHDELRLSAFFLGGLDTDLGGTLRDCVAVGVKARPGYQGKELAGFSWNSFVATTGVKGDEAVIRGWRTEGLNVAHNNAVHGIFTWLNGIAMPGHHENNDFLLYRNGGAGIKNGAYASSFRYIRCILLDNAWDPALYAFGTMRFEANGVIDFGGSGMWQVHRDCYYDASGRGPVGYFGEPKFINPEVTQILDCTFINGVEGQVIRIQNVVGGNHPVPNVADFARTHVFDFQSSTDRELLDTDFEALGIVGTSAAPTVFRVQTKDDTSAYKVEFYLVGSTITKTVTSIPLFALYVQTASLTPATQGVAYSQPLVAQLAVGAVTWRLKQRSAPLPPGMSLSSAGVLFGTPTTPGNYPITVEVEDSRGATAPKDFVFVVGGVATLQITTSSLPQGELTVVYPLVAGQNPLQAANGTGPYTYALAPGSGPLPPGLSLATNGTLSGTPTVIGSYPVTFRVTDAVAAVANRPLTFTVVDPNPTITTPSLINGELLLQYGATLASVGGMAPYTYARISGAFPPSVGMSLGGVFSGTPTVPGTYNFRIRVTDSAGRSGVRDYTVIIYAALAPLGTPLPSAIIGVSYFVDRDATGGAPGPDFSLKVGNVLPPGLTVSSAGIITGTPTLAGNYQFTLEILDSLGALVSETLQLVVAASAVPVPLMRQIRAFRQRGVLSRSRERGLV